jgi:hypothetical protein
MKKINLLFTYVILMALIITSCTKDKGFDSLEYGLGRTEVNSRPFVQILEGGLRQFKRQVVAFADAAATLDSVEYTLNYVDKGDAPNDINITLAIDDALRTNYNQDPANATKYDLMPDSVYRLGKTSVTIKTGSSFSEKVKVYFYPNKVDPAKIYMLPLGIKTVNSGVFVSSNNGSILYHIIGNPLAGDYTVEGYLYHPTVPRAFTRVDDEAKLVAFSDKALVTELGDLGGSGFFAVITVPDPLATTIQQVTITSLAGSIENVSQFDAGLPTSNPGYLPAWPKSNLCNNTYDPATKTFYLRYGYPAGGVVGSPLRVSEEVIKRN